MIQGILLTCTTTEKIETHLESGPGFTGHRLVSSPDPR